VEKLDPFSCKISVVSVRKSRKCIKFVRLKKHMKNDIAKYHKYRALESDKSEAKG